MPDIAQALTSLDHLLHCFNVQDLDSELLHLEPSKRAAAKREREFSNIMGMVSVEQLRKLHFREVIQCCAEGCAEYFYAHVRVHSGHELTYHEFLSAICGGDHPKIYDEEKIVAYWSSWWQGSGRRPKWRTLDWRPSSETLCSGYDALTTLDSKQLERYFSHPRSIVRQCVARREDIDEEIQYQLADDAEPAVRFCLARNRNAARDVLGEMANDLNSIVRRWVACHPNTPASVLERLREDPVEEVRRFLERRRA